MNKNMFRGLAIVLALLLCGAALAEVRTTGNVWLRTGPGLGYDQVTSFKEGKSLSFLGETSVDDRGVMWYKVSAGDYTGWVSSRYSELVGETLPAEVPEEDSADAPEPEPAEVPGQDAAEAGPTDEPAGMPALDAGVLFTDSVAGDEAAKATELAGYYLDELVTAANELGLISYREVDSEVPYQYYNDALVLAGSQYVENIVVSGAGYEVFGVSVGMSQNAAIVALAGAGLDYTPSPTGITFEHPGSESAFYVDEAGHDSCISLTVEDDVVTGIDWSTYTG